MRCATCGAEIPPEASFCPQCGARLPENPSSDAGGATELDRPFEPLATDEARPTEPASAPDAPAAPEAATPREQLQSAARATVKAPEEEKTVWTGSYSGKAMVGHFVVGILVTVILAVVYFKMWTFGKALLWSVATLLMIEAILWVWLGVRKLSVGYELTNQRFIHKRGLLSRVTDRIELIDIDDVTFRQGPVERMLGVGTIVITSSDRTHPELELRGIDHVAEVSDKIDDLRRDERRRRSLHIEAV